MRAIAILALLSLCACANGDPSSRAAGPLGRPQCSLADASAYPGAIEECRQIGRHAPDLP